MSNGNAQLKRIAGDRKLGFNPKTKNGTFPQKSAVS
jgi:hypothetical protein